MDIEIVKDALESSLSLLNAEFESVTLDELKDEYMDVIRKIENSLKLIESD